MDAISVRCKSCRRLMKFAVEKAGKKAKCPQCGTIAVIEPPASEPDKAADEIDEAAELLLAEDPAPPPPAKEQEAEPQVKVDEESDVLQLVEEPAKKVKAKKKKLVELPAEPAPEPEPDAPEPPPPAPDPAPAPAPAPNEFDNDGPAEYGVYIDPELEERKKILKEQEEAEAKKKKERKKLPKVLRKKKPIDDADSWTKVRVGLLFLALGTGIWIFAHVLQGAYVLLGSNESPEYAILMGTTMETRFTEELPPVNQFWDVDEFEIYLGMIAGRTFVGFAKVCITLAVVLYFFQAIAWGMGYILCLAVPRRLGMFGQVLLMMALLIFNGLIMFSLKFLPIVGAYNYIMIPFVTPEISMTEYNMERMIPIHLLWSGAPFWENFLTILFKFALYMEPTIGCVFVWSIGVAIKEEELERGGRRLAEICMGTMLIIISFHLFSVCGATPVMVGILRVFYGLWYFFTLLFTLPYIMLLMRCRTLLYAKIHPENEATVEE